MRVNLRSLVLFTTLAFGGCSCGEEGGGGASTGSMRDAGGSEDGGGGEPDGGEPPPFMFDASDPFPGDPPPALADETCASDTSEVYTLATTNGEATAAELAVDLIGSRFGTTFVGPEGAACGVAVQFAELFGAAGENTPEPDVAYDGCSLIERVALMRSETDWLMAIVDNRDGRELWVQAMGEGATAHRISENMAAETDVALAPLDGERNLIAWTEAPFFGGPSSLHVRSIAADGEPLADAVVLEESETRSWHGLRIAMLSAPDSSTGSITVRPTAIALAYRRDDSTDGTHSAVLDVLDLETLERLREPWVLTAEAGATGTVDVAGDELGAAVAYTFAQGPSRQLWFQQLSPTGTPATIMSGGLTGGAAEPQRVVGNPELAVDVSIAKLAQGYAVGYRALPSIGVPSPVVRVHFLDRFGRVIGDSSIALASEAGGQTAIEAAYDGRIAMSWVDTDAEGQSSLRALILPCAGAN